MKPKLFLEITLKGIGASLTNNTVLGGLIIFLGIAIGSPILALAALLGTIVSTVAAIFLKYPKKEIEKGSFGFNGTYLAVALFFFFSLSPALLFVTIIGSAATSFIMNFFLREKIEVYALPFAAVAWIFYYALPVAGFAKNSLLSAGAPVFEILPSALLGFGQILFQESLLASAVFLLAIFLKSRSAALFSAAGSLIGALIALVFGASPALINLGLFSYNSALCGLILGSKKKISIGKIFFAIILSALLTIALRFAGILPLLFPFLISVWTVEWIKKQNKKLF